MVTLFREPCPAPWSGLRSQMGSYKHRLAVSYQPLAASFSLLLFLSHGYSPSHGCFRVSLQLTLRNRLNAISHRRPVPSLNGTAAPSMGFGSSPAAEPSDPSPSKRNLRYRAFSEPVQPPPVIRASDRPDVVGVLGGISPQATANFMRQVIQATPATANKDHAPLIVSSIPQIPSLSAPILNRPAGPGSDEAVVSPLPALLQTRRFLEQSGARCIVMPSNMAHFWCKLSLFLRTIQYGHGYIPIRRACGRNML
jgi:hypothetical protein